MASSLDTRAAGDAVGDVGTDAPQDAHDLYGFDAGVADAGVTPGTLEHLDEPGAAPGDAPSAAAEDPRGLPEDRVPEAPHKALDRIDQPGPAPRADVPSQNANTEPSPPPARETRTAEVQTDPIDDLDRYCVDLDAEAQAPGPSQVRKQGARATTLPPLSGAPRRLPRRALRPPALPTRRIRGMSCRTASQTLQRCCGAWGGVVDPLV